MQANHVKFGSSAGVDAVVYSELTWLLTLINSLLMTDCDRLTNVLS